MNTSPPSVFGSWSSVLSSAAAVVAAVWGIGLGVLIVGTPIALCVKLALYLGRMARDSF
jgi:hypothetical protein